MARGNGDLVAALDIGSSKVCCFIADDLGDAGLRVIGIGHQLSQGVRAGRVTSMEALEGAVLSAVHTAEQMAGERIAKVYLNLSGGAPTSHRVDVNVPLSRRGVADSDIARAFAEAQLGFDAENRKLVHALPVRFAIDGERGVRDPRGMFGERLGVVIHLVSVASGAFKTIRTAVERCHLEIAAPVVSAYASGLACLVEDEAQLGAVVIDMGGGTTEIAVFFEGEMVFTDTVPVGGAHVTNDIARGLATPTLHAERMKTLLGNCLPGPRDEREMIEVPALGEGEEAHANAVPKSVLVGIIRPRIEETFELVRAKLEKTGFAKFTGRRAVLTGGASQLQGIPEFAGHVLGKQVRIGRPLKVQGLAEATGGPAFSTCAGLLLYATQKHPQTARMAAGKPQEARGQLGRLGQWLRENF